jgi:RHS repeat-associated protein
MIRSTDDNLFDGDQTADADHFLYDGRDFDPEAGLQYNRARHYDPTVGRWITQDPIGYEAGDVNLYRYVGNAPCNDSDVNKNTPKLGFGASLIRAV